MVYTNEQFSMWMITGEGKKVAADWRFVNVLKIVSLFYNVLQIMLNCCFLKICCFVAFCPNFICLYIFDQTFWNTREKGGGGKEELPF